MIQHVIFFAAAAVALGSALVAVSHRSPVVNVLSLVVSFFCVAVNYALLGASFLAAAQILVYAGAILVLFLFVVMLLNAPAEPASQARPVQGAAGALLAVLTALGGLALVHGAGAAAQPPAGEGTAVAVGKLLVGPYLLAFEAVSVVLLAALVGALVLVKRKH